MSFRDINVIYDATWPASNYNFNGMHGGLRVSSELISLMSKELDINVFFSVNRFDLSLMNSLRTFVESEFGYKNDKIANNYFFYILSFYYKSKDKNFLNSFLKYKLFKNRIFDTKKLMNIDIYHSPLDSIPNEIKSFNHIKKVFTSHDLLPFVRPDLSPPEFYNTLKPAYDSIDESTTVIAVSKSTKNDLLEYNNKLKEEQIKVVYLGADRNIFFPNKGLEQFLYLKNKYKFYFDGYLLCLNRVQPYKNSQVVIDVYVDLIDSGYLKNIGLILIGSFGNFQIKTEFLKKYSNYNILFIDFVPEFELSFFYSNSICFLYMSLFEGFGLPVLEAMQCGAPVICSSAKSIPEVAGDACLLVDPLDKYTLSQCILNVSNNLVLRNQLSVNGIIRSSLFSWDKYVSEVKSIYRNLL